MSYKCKFAFVRKGGKLQIPCCTHPHASKIMALFSILVSSKMIVTFLKVSCCEVKHLRHERINFKNDINLRIYYNTFTILQ